MTATSVRNHAFISYSHRDRPWVDRLLVLLKPFLKSGRLEVWEDRYIQVGDDWRREIGGGMAGARVGVLLVSPEFAASDFITDVEVPAVRAAAGAGDLRIFCVPIRSMPQGVTDLLELGGYQWARDPEAPLEPLLEAERHTALVEIVDALVACFGPLPVERTAVATPAAPVEALAVTASAPLGALHGVPELPPNFLPRSGTIEDLKRAVLNTQRQRFGISASARMGLHGQGGLGKTVMASALARDQEIRRAFPDGIFWVTLGQQPGVLALQKDLAQAASGVPAELPSIPLGTARLLELLGEKRCLLVLDDVWQAAHAQAFAAVGPRGRLLVTTRDRQILTGLGAEPHELEALEPASALELLASWSGARVPLPVEAARVAEECGHLPLALSLAGAQVREGLSWKKVLAALDRGRLQFLDHPHGSVFKSMSASIAALDPTESARYRELAIFPEDAEIPETVIARLWSSAGLDDLQTTKLLLSFAGRGLLRCTGEDGSLVVTVHDLQGDFLRLIAEDTAADHRRLLDAYALTLPTSQSEPEAVRWAALPKAEVYLWKNIATHMLEADRASVFDALARNHRWLAAKIEAVGVAGMLADLTILVERAPTAGNRAVEKAVRLESGWLYQDPKALAGLLYNRLLCEGLTPAEIGDTVADLPRPPLRLRHPVRLGGAGLRIFRGHSEAVVACAYSPDGTRILSASHDETVREWDRQTGQELRVFWGHSAPVVACAYSPDGTRILSASHDKTVREWDRQTGQQLYCFDGHSKWVTACAYSPDGARILSASGDVTVREWDRRTGQQLHCFNGHSRWVTACAYSPDGTRILSASHDKTVREWDRQTGQELHRFDGHSNWVAACAYSPDGTRILSASHDNTLREWDRQTGRELYRFVGHEDSVNACAYSPDGTRILSVSLDKTVREWDQQTGQQLHRFDGPWNPFNACAYSRDGTNILTASHDATVREWDRQTGQELHRFDGHSRSVTACAFSPDGTRILSASGDKTVREWDWQTGQELYRFGAHSRWVNACAYSADGARILSASAETVREWDRQTGQELHRFDGHSYSISACAYSPDGTRILSASYDNTVREWDRTTGRELRRFDGHSYSVNACAYSPDGTRVLSASHDNTVREWDRTTGRELHRFDGHSNRVRACAYSPDGSRILSASHDNTVREWDRQTGQELHCFDGHSNWVAACAYSPDGALLVSASHDNTVKIWARDGSRLLTLYGAAPFVALAVARGRVAAGDALGNVWILDCDLI